ncbi:TRAP transporter large permease [Oceanibacterium hippocampi]|uniref:TRAP transporter large permease protein n=1 Tax=Oceanibacterium hippocampi TaxID=745714 RepID=A0A1Y5S5A8_9PROT|nr:TRAP transporter large permease [Oceanibacterium hippocampi]SLN32433.1 Sialic acid TRAP transporter permease protein SiaT [Oceanibacterium hippocampi]
MMTALILCGLILLLLTGAPIFAALGLASMVVMLLTEGNINSVADTVFAKLNNGLLTAIPMFAFMAHVMIRSKVVDDLYDAANAMVGHLRGGLGVATILSCSIFAAISGSSVATALTIGSSAIPQMLRFRYRPPDAYGVLAAGGTLGILIPPSGPLILYAVVTEASIGALFLAGMLPGIMMALLFAVWSMVNAARRKEIERQPFAGARALVSSLRRAIWALIMPPLVLGGIYLGVFTASEAAAIGSIYALFVGAVIYRNFGLRDLWETAYETVRTTTMLFMILASAAVFGHAVTIIRLPLELVEQVAAAGMTPLGFVLAVMALIFVLGMFLETISIILITTPIVFPVMLELGIDPIWYGILLMINLELALITPPVGMNLFVIKGIAKAPLGQVIQGSLPYAVLMLAGLGIVLVFPQIATWLPDLAGFGR